MDRYIYKELRHLQVMEQQVQPRQRGWVRGILIVDLIPRRSAFLGRVRRSIQQLQACVDEDTRIQRLPCSSYERLLGLLVW